MADPKVKLDNSGLQEVDGEIVAVGFLDIDAMRALKYDDYQREFLGVISAKGGRVTHIMRAISQGVRLPGIVIGTRGNNYSALRNSIMVLEDETYVIDGRQRVETLLQFAEMHPERADKLTISCEVRFNTNHDSEEKLFHALNAWRTAVSGNVLLRNMRKHYYGVQLLYDWTHSRRSLLFQRVQWDQRMKRGELITALVLAQVTTAIHNYGHISGGNAEALAKSMDVRLNRFAGQEMRDNMIYFFDLIDECFGLSKIEYRQQATVLRLNFLMGVAIMLAGHENFWRGRNLHVTRDHRHKLAKFPINDPEIMRLAGAGLNAMPIFLDLLVKHMNKGASKNRLRPRRKQHNEDDE